jgi:hypothetical protein
LAVICEEEEDLEYAGLYMPDQYAKNGTSFQSNTVAEYVMYSDFIGRICCRKGGSNALLSEAPIKDRREASLPTPRSTKMEQMDVALGSMFHPVKR